MRSAKYECDPAWLGNARFIAFHTENNGVLSKRTQSLAAIDLEALVSPKPSTSDSPGALKKTTISLSEGSLRSPRPSAPRISAAEELKNFLRKELSLTTHPVRELVNTFKKDYQVYAGGFQDTDFSSLTSDKDLEEMYQQAVLPVKSITTLLRDFLILLYKEIVTSFDQILQDEDSRYEQVIDHLLSQLIFDDVNSSMYQHIYKCLELKNRELLKSYRATIRTFRNKSIKELDNQLSEDLTLSKTKAPYQNVIDAIVLPRMLANPYLKKDYLSTLEDEMVSSILQYNEEHLQPAGRVQLEPDEKFAIYTYCLIRSGYANIILDTAFIEEFSIEEQNNQTYARFAGCLHDYILSGDLEQYLPSAHRSSFMSASIQRR